MRYFIQSIKLLGNVPIPLITVEVVDRSDSKKATARAYKFVHCRFNLEHEEFINFVVAEFKSFDFGYVTFETVGVNIPKVATLLLGYQVHFIFKIALRQIIFQQIQINLFSSVAFFARLVVNSYMIRM